MSTTLPRLPLAHCFVAAAALTLASCGGAEPAARAPGGEPVAASPPPTELTASVRPLLADVTGKWGLASTDPPWPDGSYDLPEIMQGGVALFDYDGDEDLDLLHVRVPRPDEPGSAAPNRLYRFEDDGRFVDVSAGSGLDDAGFGQGVAIGDVDNDGDLDVYVTNYGPDAFFLNRGDGTFVEATAAAGFSGGRWSSSAAFLDYDGDGFLDLFVTHYLKYDPDTICLDDAERRDYCGPRAFHGEPDKLYRNQGDGTFLDVTLAAGIQLPEGGERARGLGVIAADMTGDDRVDLYVANDGESNQLWVNQGDGTFIEQGILRGVGVSGSGRPEASMGVALGDANGDGRDDLFMTHLAKENNRLFMGGGQLFADRSRESGLSAFDLEVTGFGCGFFDLDHDTDLDLAVVNGAVRRQEKSDSDNVSDFWRDFAQPNLLFRNDGHGKFEKLVAEAGDFATTVEVTRSLAFGDIDRDGDLDLVISNVDNTLRAYRNDAPTAGTHWLQVRAMTGRRDALGALVTLRAGGVEQRRWLLAASSYMTSNAPHAHFGLGSSQRVDEIVVLWPDGRRERFPGAEAGQAIVLRQGEGGAP